ncbi:MAG: ribonucleoside-diphosphate reductase beta chain [Solirubrobacteraceae bacterium]|jgi:ribonucleotide reductase beta subunit family protein with ferritin-like domain|nr:ribonucleoside-diphosphate reductase beta chain [Solirubrobacteraceae bacterium]
MAVTVPPATEQIDYADLYARWERGNWSATEIDFTQDRIDWHEHMTPEQRRSALWLYTLFFHGEDSVTDNLSPYIDAVPLEEQKYFLATQQADEARHAVFFHRFLHEVVGVGSGSLASGLQATAPELTWGHGKTFRRLDEMAAQLRRDRSPLMLAKAVTLYHVVVEGTLAQPGQHIIESSLERLDLLPGFREGMGHVSTDEQRHIAFGVRLLADLYSADPAATQEAIVDVIRELVPYVLSVPIPPGWDETYTTCFGYTLEDVFEEGARANEARLRAIGLPLDDIHHFPFPMDISPRERGKRALVLLRAGLLGERNGPVDRDPHTVRTFFDLLARNARAQDVAPGTTIQWDFTDMDPWYLLLEAPDRKSAIQGRVPKPDVRLKMRWEDFGDLVSQRANPYQLAMRGRMRPWGDPRLLLKLQRLFH